MMRKKKVEMFYFHEEASKDNLLFYTFAGVGIDVGIDVDVDVDIDIGPGVGVGVGVSVDGGQLKQLTNEENRSQIN